MLLSLVLSFFFKIWTKIKRKQTNKKNQTFIYFPPQECCLPTVWVLIIQTWEMAQCLRARTVLTWWLHFLAPTLGSSEVPVLKLQAIQCLCFSWALTLTSTYLHTDKHIHLWFITMLKSVLDLSIIYFCVSLL